MSEINKSANQVPDSQADEAGSSIQVGYVGTAATHSQPVPSSLTEPEEGSDNAPDDLPADTAAEPASDAVYHQVVPGQKTFLMNLPVEILKLVADEVLGNSWSGIRPPRNQPYFLVGPPWINPPTELRQKYADDSERHLRAVQPMAFMLRVSKFWRGEMHDRGLWTLRDTGKPLLHSIKDAFDEREEAWKRTYYLYAMKLRAMERQFLGDMYLGALKAQFEVILEEAGEQMIRARDVEAI